MALMVKTLSILPENTGDSSYIQNLFLLRKKSIPDAILNQGSQSPPYEYIEGGDFRDTLKVFLYASRCIVKSDYH
nr:hypothetical protein [Nostoc sp. EkiNYC01]